MSLKYSVLVWDNAPNYGVSGNHLLVLLRLADAASEDNGMGWEARSTIAKKVCCSERTVTRVLSDLAEWGIIRDVIDPMETPEEALRYQSVVRQIRPLEDWQSPQDRNSGHSVNPNSGQNVHSSDLAAGSQLGGDKMSPNPSQLTTSTSSQLDTSYPTSCHATRSAHRVAKQGWEAVPTPRAKGKARAKQQAAEEISSDPFSVLLAEDPQPEPEVDLDLGRKIVAARRKSRREGPAARLAGYFETKAAHKTAKFGRAPGDMNQAALGRQFATWLREGHAEADIRAMVDHYWADGSYGLQRDESVPAWRDFLNRRGVIHSDVVRGKQATEADEHATDASYWIGF